MNNCPESRPSKALAGSNEKPEIDGNSVRERAAKAFESVTAASLAESHHSPKMNRLRFVLQRCQLTRTSNFRYNVSSTISPTELTDSVSGSQKANRLAEVSFQRRAQSDGHSPSFGAVPLVSCTGFSTALEAVPGREHRGFCGPSGRWWRVTGDCHRA
jgi:hypothetical protein